MKDDIFFMKRAIELAREGMANGLGGPFGAVIVKDGKIIAEGCNMVTSTNDPTAHAEVVAIRNACEMLGDFQIEGCTIYSSCEPCPMCLGAIYWARPERIVIAANRKDAAAISFDDDYIYRELTLTLNDRSIPVDEVGREEALKLFNEWNDLENKLEY